MAERTIQAGDVEICTEAFGDPADPALLLIMGAGGSMLKWEEEFVQRLVGAGRYAIRYDNRDTGQSTNYPAGEPPYTLLDMTSDAITVLDAYQIEKAHVLGRSMGGMITQHVVLEHPHRVKTATLIYSSPSPGVAGASDESQCPLPGATSELMALMVSAPGPDSDPEAKMAHRLEMQRILNGSGYAFDRNRCRALIEREMQRARDFTSSVNHTFAIRNTPPWRHRLTQIRTPTLVVHGTQDPILPLPHGEALASEIADAEMMVLEGVGHALPVPVWDELIPTLLRHTSRNN